MDTETVSLDRKQKKDTKAFSTDDFQKFQDQLNERRIEVNRLLKQRIGNPQEGLTEIYNNVFNQLTQRFKDLQDCMKVLNDSIDKLTDALKKETDEERLRLTNQELDNRETYRSLVLEELEMEDFYKTDAMKKLMLVYGNNDLARESPDE